MYDTPVNLQTCNLADILNLFDRYVFRRKQFWYGLKGGGHHLFKAANFADNLAKIPKSVNVTGFPLSSFKYLVYLAELCCDSKDEVPVVGHSWSRSCHLAVGVVGVVGTFSLPFNLCHSPCGFLYNHLYCPPTTPLRVQFSFCDGC